MNLIILMGRLTMDPETRYSQDNKAITKFKLAVDKKIKKDNQPTAIFVNCVCFGSTAEFVSKYFSKGSRIAIEGELDIRQYKDKADKPQTFTEVIVSSVHFADSKKTQETEPNTYTAIESDVTEDELPF